MVGVSGWLELRVQLSAAHPAIDAQVGILSAFEFMYPQALTDLHVYSLVKCTGANTYNLCSLVKRVLSYYMSKEKDK